MISRPIRMYGVHRGVKILVCTFENFINVFQYGEIPEIPFNFSTASKDNTMSEDERVWSQIEAHHSTDPNGGIVHEDKMYSLSREFIDRLFYLGRTPGGDTITTPRTASKVFQVAFEKSVGASPFSYTGFFKDG